MAAPIAEKCDLCFSMLNYKNYRRLDTKSSKEQYGQIFETLNCKCAGYCCNLCANKLNKLAKIDTDLKIKHEKGQREKAEILQKFNSMPGITRLERSTPFGKSVKRPVMSPTGCTPRSKRSLFVTPKKVTPILKKLTPLKKSTYTTEKSTQTSNYKEFDVKVTVKYKDRERSKVVLDSKEQAALRTMVNNGNANTVIKHLSKSEKYKVAMLNVICKIVSEEVACLSKRSEPALRVVSTDDLLQLDWKKKANELKEIVPSVMSVLTSIVGKSEKSLCRTLVALSILVYSRCQLLNLLQMTLGQVIDSCGLNKEGINIIHDLGVCASYTSVRKRRKDLVLKQQEKIRATVKDYVKQQSKCANTGTDLLTHIGTELVKFATNIPASTSTDLPAHTSTDLPAHTGTDLPANSETVLPAHTGTDLPTHTGTDLPAHTGTDLPAHTGTDIPANSGNDLPANNGTDNLKPFEILGDNFDISISPTQMTQVRQRQSHHWFLTMAKVRRVLYEDCHITGPEPTQPPIQSISTSKWIPSLTDIQALKENFMFHIAQVLMKYVDFLKPVVKVYPAYIDHPYIEKTKQKSVILNCDLIEESENSSTGMITILQNVHRLAVPHDHNNAVKQRVVFGGDVLTNERAFSAQQAMQNDGRDFDRLFGVTHRPEGLHRQFNFLTCIYQLFYKTSSGMDTGSLYQLRNLINRRDVSGADAVVQKFRPHLQFVNDVTDAYIVSACLDFLNLEDTSSIAPGSPLFNLISKERQIDYVNQLASRVIEEFNLTDLESVAVLRQDIESLNNEELQLQSMQENGRYSCPLCGKGYRSLQWFRKHLEKKHHWQFHTVNNYIPETNAVKHFLFMSLLFRDTCDSYKMSDGERSFRNAYFEWLYDSALKHSKYKIWLWRMLSYSMSVIGFKESFEYKWNPSVNLNGGITNNIPNDNAVEIQVNNIKRELNTQGVNKCYTSARSICLTTQVTESIKQNLIRTTRTARSKRERPPCRQKCGHKFYGQSH